MDFKLERPNTSHVAQIGAVWEAGWHDGHADIAPPQLSALRTTDSFMDRALANLSITVIAVDAGQVLGFSMVKEDELYQMFVSDQARGTGVAQALIQEAERKINAAGYHAAWLGCAVGNTRASRFYEKSGWVNVRLQVVDLDTSEGPFPTELWRFEKQF